MNSKNKSLLIIGVIIVAIFLITTYGNKIITTGSTFSIVGSLGSCDENAHISSTTLTAYPIAGGAGQTISQSGGYWQIPGGYKVSITKDKTTSICGLPYAFYNTFVDWGIGSGFEYRDELPSFSCPAGKTCQVEAYCCPTPFCASDDNCRTWGIGDNGKYTCVFSKSCSSNADCSSVLDSVCSGGICQDKNIKPGNFNTWSYCATQIFTCWYYDGTNCVERPYPQSYGSCATIGTYQGKTLYSDKATCDSNKPQTCAQQGGAICTGTQTCTGTIKPATDSNSCCVGGVCENPTTCSGQGICKVVSSCPSGETSLGKLDCGLLQLCCKSGTECPIGQIRCSDGTCKTSCTTPTNIKTITWTEYYSMNDEDFGKGQYSCKVDTDCPAKTDYAVSCSDNEKFTNRIYDIVKKECDEALGWWDNLISGILRLGTLNLIRIDFCGDYAKGYTEFKGWWSGNGVCIAESTTWYGKIWDQGLNLVGGLGLPAQYVVIITIMLIIALFALAISFIK